MTKATNWKAQAALYKTKYETISTAFQELAIGNTGAYERRMDLERSVRNHMLAEDGLLRQLAQRDELIAQLRKQLRARAKKKPEKRSKKWPLKTKSTKKK